MEEVCKRAEAESMDSVDNTLFSCFYIPPRARDRRLYDKYLSPTFMYEPSPTSTGPTFHLVANDDNHSNKITKRTNKKIRRLKGCEHVASSLLPHDHDDDTKKRSFRLSDDIERKFLEGPEPPPEMPEWMRRLIADRHGGSGEKLIIQKKLLGSDLKRNQNRLSMPFKQVRQTEEFLNDDELSDVGRRDNNNKIVGVRATVIGAIDSEVMEIAMDFKRWELNTSSNFILTQRWYDFAILNRLRTKQLIQVWFFRDSHQKPCFAFVNLDADNNQNLDTTASASASASVYISK